MSFSRYAHHIAKEVASEAAAVKKLIDGHLTPNCGQLNCQAFRTTRYWNEECDNLYKSHFALFEHLYQSRSGSHRLPGERTYGLE